MMTLWKVTGLMLFSCVILAQSDTFTIGFLSGNSGRNGLTDFSLPGLRISAAISVAIEEINNSSYLPFDHQLSFQLAETFGEEIESIFQTAELWRENVSAFIGPQETCIHEARLASSFNLPMISHYCTHPATSDKDKYPTFCRTKPPASLVGKSLTTTLMAFNWTQVAFFYSSVNNSEYRDVAEACLINFKAAGINLLHIKDWHEMFHFGWTESNFFEEWIKETKDSARIYVIIGEPDAHLGLLEAMDHQEMFFAHNEHEYFVIGVGTDVWDESDPGKFLRGFLSSKDEAVKPSIISGMRHYMGIVGSPPQESDGWSYKQFEQRVKQAMTKPPFDKLTEELTLPYLILRREAAYLYDAVMLYAWSLKQSLLAGEDPYNGTSLIARLFNRSYKSALGFDVFMDQNGDPEGNYSLIALDTQKGTLGLYPIGSFIQQQPNIWPELKLSRSIKWPNGKPPPDAPFCGFKGEFCLQDYAACEIAMGVIGGVAVVLSVVIILAYRNYKYEQELDSLLWKIDPEEVQEDEFTPTHHNSHHNRKSSQMSLNSNQGDDFKYSTIYTRVGFYKGRIHAIKKFLSSQLEINRSIKKDLKCLTDLRHDNLNAFVGACVEPGNIFIVTEYCPRGSLKDILMNSDFNLDNMFMASLIFDMVRGMIYLHDSPIGFHGNLKASNCLVDSRWVLKLADFGLQVFKVEWPDLPQILAKSNHIKETLCESLLYRAPELLRTAQGFSAFNQAYLQKSDAYSFAIILYELHVRKGPFGGLPLMPSQILKRVIVHESKEPFRPDLKALNHNCSDFVKTLLPEAWAENPLERPDFKMIRNRLRPLRKGMRANIFDNMLAMMEKYANNLEVLVDDRTQLLIEEKRKTDALLHEMLPKPVSDQLKQGKPVEAESFDCVTIFFSDIVGFTEMCAESKPLQVVDFLNDLYTCFDETLEQYDVYKVETIGDAYMVASGVPVRNGDQHAGEIASFALELLESVHKFEIRHRPRETLKLRVGIHSGPVCSGVVGRKMPRFCLFGDTVNTASRMESTGEPLKVHCSQPCMEKLNSLGGYHFEEKGVTQVKGKGEMTTYWLIGQDLTLAKIRAMNRRKHMHKNKSCASSIQDLDFFKSNPKLSSRRGSCRKSGSYLDGLSPTMMNRNHYEQHQHEMGRPTNSLPLNSSALALAINGQLASVTKPLVGASESYPQQQQHHHYHRSTDVGVYLAIPNPTTMNPRASPIVSSPCSSVQSRMSPAFLTENTYVDFKSNVKYQEETSEKSNSIAMRRRNLQFTLPTKKARRFSVAALEADLARENPEKSPLLH